jgi:ubiquinone/menaquinone biosynthesis C-methylase UbiE
MLPLVTDAAPVLADVQALTFSRRCFDLVLAPHMLYHVPDIGAAAREIRRARWPNMWPAGRTATNVDIPWAEVVRRVHKLASAAVSSDGELTFTTGVGAFVCR